MPRTFTVFESPFPLEQQPPIDNATCLRLLGKLASSELEQQAVYEEKLDALLQIAYHLRCISHITVQALRRLLQRHPQVLVQLATVLTAGLKHVLRSSSMVPSVGVLCDTLAGCIANSPAMTAKDGNARQQLLQSLAQLGLLDAWAAAAAVAAQRLESQRQQQQQLTLDRIAMGTFSMLTLGSNLYTVLQLRVPQSGPGLLLATVEPMAALSLAALQFVSSLDETAQAVIDGVTVSVLGFAYVIAKYWACGDIRGGDELPPAWCCSQVQQLLLLRLACLVQHLHMQHEKSLAAPASSSSSSRKHASVQPHHELLLHAVAGVPPGRVMADSTLPAHPGGACSRGLRKLVNTELVAVAGLTNALQYNSSFLEVSACSSSSNSTNSSNSSNSSSSNSSISSKWHLCVRVQLTLAELLALAPPPSMPLSLMGFVLEDMTWIQRMITNYTLAQPTEVAIFKEALQLLPEAVLLLLGPVVLRVCKRASGEEDEAADQQQSRAKPLAIGAAELHTQQGVSKAWDVEGSYGQLVLTLLPSQFGAPILSEGARAAFKAEPLLCSRVVEAGVRAAAAKAGSSVTTCGGLSQLATLAEVAGLAAAAGTTTALAAPAAAAAGHDGKLAVQLFSQLLSGLKVVARPGSINNAGTWWITMEVLAKTVAAGLVLAHAFSQQRDDASSSSSSNSHGSTSASTALAAPTGTRPGVVTPSAPLWFGLVTRCCIAAGMVLGAEPPAGGRADEQAQVRFVHVLPALQQLCAAVGWLPAQLLQLLPDGPSGTAALQVQQHAATLQSLLAAAMEASTALPLAGVMQQSEAEALAWIAAFRRVCGGELPQLLAEFGAACAAAVPVPCCNNPACSNLDKFSEMGLARSGCAACKVTKYCSRDCQKQHWKAHKVECGCIQQRAARTAWPQGAGT